MKKIRKVLNITLLTLIFSFWLSADSQGQPTFSPSSPLPLSTGLDIWNNFDIKSIKSSYGPRLNQEKKLETLSNFYSESLASDLTNNMKLTTIFTPNQLEITEHQKIGDDYIKDWYYCWTIEAVDGEIFLIYSDHSLTSNYYTTCTYKVEFDPEARIWKAITERTDRISGLTEQHQIGKWEALRDHIGNPQVLN